MSRDHEGVATRAESHPYQPSTDADYSPCKVCGDPPISPVHPTITDTREDN